jgi:hypothetical protein
MNKPPVSFFELIAVRQVRNHRAAGAKEAFGAQAVGTQIRKARASAYRALAADRRRRVVNIAGNGKSAQSLSKFLKQRERLRDVTHEQANGRAREAFDVALL